MWKRSWPELFQSCGPALRCSWHIWWLLHPLCHRLTQLKAQNLARCSSGSHQHLEENSTYKIDLGKLYCFNLNYPSLCPRMCQECSIFHFILTIFWPALLICQIDMKSFLSKFLSARPGSWQACFKNYKSFCTLVSMASEKQDLTICPVFL